MGDFLRQAYDDKYGIAEEEYIPDNAISYYEWLKTNPSVGYYWVSSRDNPEPYIDEFTHCYDNNGYEGIKFLCQPDYVYYKVEDFDDNYDKNEVNELREKLKTVCSILLKKDSLYDAWIEKNIGKEYL